MHQDAVFLSNVHYGWIDGRVCVSYLLVDC